MTVYGHWIDRAHDAALALGIRGGWLHADRLGDAGYTAEFLATCRAYPDFRFVLFVYPTQSRLLNEGGIWTHQMTHAVTWVRDQGIAGQCSLIQFGDEWWSHLFSGALTSSPHWPILFGMTPVQCWGHRDVAAYYWGLRARDLRAIWQRTVGTACPPIGMADCFPSTPPEFNGQEWWGANVYLLPGGYFHRAADVQALYGELWAQSRLPVMPVLPFFEEGRLVLPSIVELGACYVPIVRHPRTFAVGVFAIHHPSRYSRDHGAGRGVLELHDSYQAGVRWLCAEVTHG